MSRSKRILALAFCVMTLLLITCAFMTKADPIVPAAATATDSAVPTAADVPLAQTPEQPAEQSRDTLNKQPAMQALSIEVAEKSTLASGGITTEMIQQVCDKYGYQNGKYWCVYENDGTRVSGNQSGNLFTDRENGCSTRMATVAYRLDAGDHPVESGNYYKSYNYMNQYECHGFACYVMAKVVQRKTGRDRDVVPRMGDRNGWKRIPADKATDLKVGDIVRIEDDYNQHSAVVYSIDKKGRATFLESGGGASCRIRLGKGFNFSEELDTLEKIRSRYTLEYVYRYTGKNN